MNEHSLDYIDKDVINGKRSKFMYARVVITCKKCGDINYLNSEALGNLTDFSYKCPYCNTINRITLEGGEVKEQE
jgi:RNase P subunit RPR2